MAKSSSSKLMVVCAAMMVVVAAMADVGDAAATCKANVGVLVTKCYRAVVADQKYRERPTPECCEEVKAFMPCFCRSKHVSQPDFSLGKAAEGFVGKLKNLIKKKFSKPNPKNPSREIPKVSVPAIMGLPEKCGHRCRS